MQCVEFSEKNNNTYFKCKQFELNDIIFLFYFIKYFTNIFTHKEIV